jgi:hypothetical protein
MSSGERPGRKHPTAHMNRNRNRYRRDNHQCIVCAACGRCFPQQRPAAEPRQGSRGCYESASLFASGPRGKLESRGRFCVPTVCSLTILQRERLTDLSHTVPARLLTQRPFVVIPEHLPRRRRSSFLPCQLATSIPVTHPRRTKPDSRKSLTPSCIDWSSPPTNAIHNTPINYTQHTQWLPRCVGLSSPLSCALLTVLVPPRVQARSGRRWWCRKVVLNHPAHPEPLCRRI